MMKHLEMSCYHFLLLMNPCQLSTQEGTERAVPHAAVMIILFPSLTDFMFWSQYVPPRGLTLLHEVSNVPEAGGVGSAG